MIERLLGPDAPYLARLGSLAATLCGVTALLAAVVLVVRPAADNLVAFLLAAAISLGGLLLSRRSSGRSPRRPV